MIAVQQLNHRHHVIGTVLCCHMLSVDCTRFYYHSSAKHNNVRQYGLDDYTQTNEVNKPRLLARDAACSRQQHLQNIITIQA